MKLKNLEDLLQYQLQVVFDAEQQLTKALPMFEESASSIDLKKLFSLHLNETERHIERISGMAQDLNIYLKGNTCGAMQQLIKQATRFCNITAGQVMKDTGLIAYTQQIEQYEIASYTNLIQYTQRLDYQYLTYFLQQNHAEETNTFNQLNNLTTEINGFQKQPRNYFAA